MGRRAGMFKAEKRRKELKRIAKQEKKRKRRLEKEGEGVEAADLPVSEESAGESGSIKESAGEDSPEAPTEEEGASAG